MVITPPGLVPPCLENRGYYVEMTINYLLFLIQIEAKMNNGILQMQLPNGRRKPLAIAELYDRVLGVTGVLLKYEVGKVDVLDIMILLYVMRLSLLLPSNRSGQYMVKFGKA